MANPPVPEKWKESAGIPPMARSQDQVEDLAVLAKASKNFSALRLVKMLKKEYNNWLEAGASSNPASKKKFAPKVIGLFNAAVDALMNQAGGGTGEVPCGGYGDPCEQPDLGDRVNFEVLAQKIYQRLMFEARIERERAGWPV